MNKDELLVELSNLFDLKLGNLKKSLELKIETEVSRLDQKIDSNISRLETEIRHRDILIENEVIPRLKILEECYLTTSYRYQEGVIKMDSLDEDVTIMKRVITDHSHRINTLEQSTAAS